MRVYSAVRVYSSQCIQLSMYTAVCPAEYMVGWIRV